MSLSHEQWSGMGLIVVLAASERQDKRAGFITGAHWGKEK